MCTYPFKPVLIIIPIVRSQLHFLYTNNAMYNINIIFSVKSNIMSIIRNTRGCKYNTIKSFLLNVFMLGRATFCLEQATHRGQDGNQKSADPSCVPSIISSTYHKSQEFASQGPSDRTNILCLHCFLKFIVHHKLTRKSCLFSRMSPLTINFISRAVGILHHPPP